LNCRTAPLVVAVWASVWATADAGAARVDLADLDVEGNSLLRVLGSSGEGRFGVPVAGGSDIDGDGLPDLALAAMRASPLGRSFAGQVFLVFGAGTLRGSLDTARPDPSILAIVGDGPRETTGNEIWVDDVTGDGLADVLIGRTTRPNQSVRAPEPSRS